MRVAFLGPAGTFTEEALRHSAPAGDLLEEAIERRGGVKDSGRLFGAHGGVLDRADAAMMAALVGYWVARALT